MANAPKEVAKKKSSTSTSSSAKKTSGNSKATKKATKKASKQVTKFAKKNTLGFIIIIICLVIGIAGGYLGISAVTKNDTFEMNSYVHSTNNAEIEELFGEETEDYSILLLDEQYVEPGAKCVYFGKENDVTISYSYREDISHDVEERDNIDTSISGFYYVTYTNETFRYKNVVLIRTIQVVEVENNG